MIDFIFIQRAIYTVIFIHPKPSTNSMYHVIVAKNNCDNKKVTCIIYYVPKVKPFLKVNNVNNAMPLMS